MSYATFIGTVLPAWFAAGLLAAAAPLLPRCRPFWRECWGAALFCLGIATVCYSAYWFTPE